MHPFTVLADPVRRRIVEMLADGERTAGEVVTLVGGEFGIGQSAVSQQLRVLRDHGFARVRPEGARRVYALEPTAVDVIDRWLEGVRGFWVDRLDDLAAELEGRPPAPPGPTESTATGTRTAVAPSRIAGVTRTVRDLGESVAFYGAVLGLTRLEGSGAEAVFDAGGTRLVLAAHDAPTAAESVLAFEVPDLTAAVERLEAAGVVVRGSPRLVERRRDGTEEWMVPFDDPEGRPLAIVARRAPGR